MEMRGQRIIRPVSRGVSFVLNGAGHRGSRRGGGAAARWLCPMAQSALARLEQAERAARQARAQKAAAAEKLRKVRELAHQRPPRQAVRPLTASWPPLRLPRRST